MDTKSYYAHTASDSEAKPLPPKDWEPLFLGDGSGHLERVAKRAEEFAARFGHSDLAYLAGLLHDIGKYSQAFQDYLAAAGDPHQGDVKPRTDHSTAGAQYSAREWPGIGHILAYIIAGHHAGLTDIISEGTSSLTNRLNKEVEPWEHGLNLIEELTPPEYTDLIREKAATGDAFGMAFLVRMLFSCLVDADFLETEGFMSPERKAERPAWPENLMQAMQARIDETINEFPKPVGNIVSSSRTAVAEACRKAAKLTPGIFTLTVPTGGGKTLSSLAFALRHASIHGLDRVIYVIPFTSIIEQNANVFRDALQPLADELGVELVLEHHSNFVPSETKASTRLRLATENWDAPLVVTTNVQFYESLFANRTSRCRKLHRIARSVIVLDEAQSLPVDLLWPCLSALKELTSSYGCSVVLCTATQPAVGSRVDFSIGFPPEEMREIIPDPEQLAYDLQRVDIAYLGQRDDSQLMSELQDEARFLCIVNTRNHASTLYHALEKSCGSDGLYHLSATMVPEHRSQLLKTIRRRLLETDLPCRIISTQLIEAGVDIDLPIVYRSMAGMDSVAQAAGRCNREGRYERGQVRLFKSEHQSKEKFLTDTCNVTSQMIALYPDDLLGLKSIEHYFKKYFYDQEARWDTKDIRSCFRFSKRDIPLSFSFRTCAEKFRLIENIYKPVIVPWNQEGGKLCEDLRRDNPPRRATLRKVQRYTVQIPPRAFAELEHSGLIEMVHETYPILLSSDHYSEETGLSAQEPDALLTNQL